MKKVLPILGGVLAIGIALIIIFYPKSDQAPPKVKIEQAKARESIPLPVVKFTDVTKSSGIDFKHFSGAYGKKFLPETMGPGVTVLDFDQDNKPDLLFVNACPWPGQQPNSERSCIYLYRNKGDGTFEEIAEKVGLNTTIYGMSASAGDIDNDGFPDLFIAGVGSNRLYRNEGGKKFVEITPTAGIAAKGIWPAGMTAVDFEKSQQPVDFASSSTFLDYDGDGKLDLFVCHYVLWSPAIDLSINTTLTGIGRAYLQPQQFEGSQCQLFRNIDGKSFQDATESAGVLVLEKEGTDEKARSRPVAKSLGITVCDPDEDGWPDIIIANDTVRNFFFHNLSDGKGGRRFEEQGLLSNVAYAEGRARGAMGIDWGEYLPGQKGLLVANFANEPNTFLTLSDPKKPRFTDSALAFGLSGPSRLWLKFGAFFFDYDLDGRLDLLTCNGHLEPEIAKIQEGQQYAQPAQLYWNTGSRQRLFESATASQVGEDLLKPMVGRGSAYLDFDGDGDLDVVLVENQGSARLLRNDQALKHHFVRLQLQGDGSKTNRDAFGARVLIEAGDKKMEREVTCARGYLSQSEKDVTFGLENQTEIQSVTVTWPGTNSKEVWKNLKADKTYRLLQGKSSLEEISR
jgi:enediyne biosynthesis protein E4